MIIISYQISLFDDVVKKKQHTNFDNLKILSLNLQSSSKNRAEKQIRWLVSINAQILVLTEVRSLETINYIISFLEYYQYNVVYRMSNSYVTLIAVKDVSYTLLPLNEVNIDDPRVVAICLQRGEKLINLFGLYVPTCGRDLEKHEIKKRFQDNFISSIEKFCKDKKQTHIFIGDFNVLEPNHIPSYYGFQKWTYFYNFFISIDCIDAFRYIRGNVKEYSWSRGENKQRLDHAFVSRAIMSEVLDCCYIQDPVNMHLSDHAALLLEFKGNHVNE